MKKILLIATAIFLTSFFCHANVADDVRERYINDELTMNKKFVNNLKNYLDNAFENQLKRFEDEELGFTSNIGNMFSAVFSSDKLQEKYTIRSKKYFDNMEIEQQTYNMGNKYLKNVTLLRSHFYEKSENQSLPSIQVLRLPTNEVDLSGLEQHSKNSLLIEIGSELFIGMFVMLIIGVICFFVGFEAPPTWFVTIITIVISIGLSMWNDSKLIDSIREQKVEFNIDYDSILKNLNENTVKFYDNVK
jgi:hypothetical protein